jgi:hypothetical protein
MQKPLLNFWQAIVLEVMMAVTVSCLTGCGQSSNPYAPVAKLFQPSPDTDVSSDPQYNFSSFAGTVWSTKAKLAIADVRHYTGEHVMDLLVPRHFDPTDPEFTPGAETHVMAVLPVGTRLRIERLMKDNGAWGGVRVTATVDDGASPQKIVYLDEMFLGTNLDSVSATNWNVNPDMLAPYRGPDHPPAQPAPSAPDPAEIKSGYEKGYGNGRKQGKFVAQHSQTGIDFTHLFDPWQRNTEWRLSAVKTYGEDYVAAYESGYGKGFHDYYDGKR